MNDERLQHVLDSIDGALADDEFPDAMRWSPEPEHVEQDPRLLRFDGRIVPQPEQRYELAASCLPRGLRPDYVVLDELVTPTWVHQQRRSTPAGIEHAPGCSIVHEYLDRPSACQCGALDRLALQMPRQQGRASMHAPGLSIDLNVEHPAVVRLFEQLGEGMARFVEAIGQSAEEAGKAIAALVEWLRPQHEPPPRTLRDTDPRAYALELRRTRNTGPERPNAQTARRPRRHSA